MHKRDQKELQKFEPSVGWRKGGGGVISMVIALPGYVQGDGLLSSLDSGMHACARRAIHVGKG